MPLESNDEPEFALDEHLNDLAGGIMTRLHIEPPELGAALQPSRLRVVKGTESINNYSLRCPDGTKLILIGKNTYPFFVQYARTAASYFLPDTTDGPRPSKFWPEACSAMAMTLDWIASPTASPRFPTFPLGARQMHVARAFAAYTYRYLVCHEMAHIALGHVNEVQDHMGDEQVEIFRELQRKELAADRFGLKLQLESLPTSTDFVTAFASAVYFVQVTGLLDARLMLLAHLVDSRNWNIQYTHPPRLHRVFNLMQAVDNMSLRQGIDQVRSDLESLNGAVQAAASRQQEEVAASAVQLVEGAWRNLQPDVTKSLLVLFEKSPLGVLRALEPPESLTDVTRQKAIVVERLASVLPAEFQRFRQMAPSERAAHSA